MPLIHLADEPDHPLLADYVAMTDVKLRTTLEVERGLFMAESYNVIDRALAAGATPRSFMMSERWLTKFAPLFTRTPSVPVFVASEAELEATTGFHVHRGALASMQRPPLPAFDTLLEAADAADGRSRLVILEDLVDHTNVGACFRSAAALGINAVLVTPRCADPLYRRSIRVSMGTVFQVPWTRIDPWPSGIDQLRAAGYVVAGMTLGEGAITLDELVAEDHPRLALVFGTEGHGMSERADSMLDRRVTIPMAGGVDSLNVAASSAVAFYATR